MKSADEFRESLKQDQPPEGLTGLLQALWWDGKGDWEKAHEVTQNISNADGSWIHAYLHRKEGNEGNAGYWYSRSGKSHCRKPLDQEWEEIVNFLLRNSSSVS